MDIALLQRKLDILIRGGVSSENILHDLNVVARSEKVIEERLECLKTNEVHPVMPWMIKCQLPIFLR